jgi:hypothetical protein
MRWLSGEGKAGVGTKIAINKTASYLFIDQLKSKAGRYMVKVDC